MAKRKRRVRSPHPGVVLLERVLPSGVVRFQARYVDPDSGKLRKPLLDPIALPTAEARRKWAIDKAQSLAARRMLLASGAPRLEGKPVPDAIRDYLDGCKSLRDNTQTAYKAAAAAFQRFADAEGIRGTHEITPAKLAAYREHARKAPKRVSRAGARRGARKVTRERRAAGAVNVELRGVRTMVLHWRLLGLTPLLDRDAVRDGLKTLRTDLDAPEHLTPRQCADLLSATLRHDAECYVMTRDEREQGLTPGNTPRHVAIAPLVAFLLLSGCRIGEALNLRWSNVDLRALGPDGKLAGEIRLAASDTKTRRARVIALEVSPGLRRLLAAMKLCADERSTGPYVFGGAEPLGYDLAQAARTRLLGTSEEPAATKRKARPKGFGAPSFAWQTLRQTTATFLSNSPGIFGSASAFLSAKQLGHSVQVAESRYAGLERGIPSEARTLEAAMQIGEVLERVIASIQGATPLTTKLRRVGA